MPIFLLALFFYPAMAAQEPIRFAEVAFTQGIVTLEPKHTALKPGMPLMEGDRITTMSGSMIRIKLMDGAALQLGAHTEAVLQRDSQRIPTLTLVHGMALAAVKPFVPGNNKNEEKFRLRTNKISLGVRGTEFFVRQEADNPTFLCVCSGKVHAKWREGERLIEAQNHNQPLNISHTKKKAEASLSMGKDHSDEDIRELKKLL